MPAVFDLDALAAEEVAEPFRFTFGGQAFEAAVFDPRALGPFGVGDIDAGLRYMLGREQAARLAAVEQPLGMGQLQALVAAWTAHFGMDAGKAPASSRSSKSTVRPSKRTSNASTASR
jgi:hypothetical protein